MRKKFLISFFALSALLMALVASFNYLVDPYSIWQHERKSGFNMWALKADNVERKGKTISLLYSDTQPEVVFIGASQVDWGIDADSATKRLERPVYNFGVLGMTAYEQRRFVEHVMAVDPAVKEIVLAADLSKFVSGERYKTPFDESLSHEEDQIGKTYVTLSNIEQTLLSIKATEDSYDSLKANRKQNWQVPYYLAGKTLSQEALLGYFHREHWRFNRSLLLVQREGWLENIELNEKCFSEYERIAELCREHNVGLKIYIPPMHAEAMIAYADCLSVYGEWLKKLTSIAPVWTFFAMDDISTSPVNDGTFSENTNMYFWDSIHHKSDVGKWIVAKMFGKEEKGMPGDFGVLLSNDNLGPYLEHLQAGIETWRSAHPEAVEAVKYYAGFLDTVPSDIAGNTGQILPAAAMLMAGSADAKPVFDLKHKDYLELRGNGFLQPQLLKKSYLRLSDGQGWSW